MLHEGDHIGRVPAAGSFNMICVHRPSLECSRRALNEARLVQGVGMDLALDVKILANTATISTCD